MADSATFTAFQDEPVDLTIWRLTGQGSGAVEAALAANPGLARTAEQLADGHEFSFPIAPAAPRVVPLIQLWD